MGGTREEKQSKEARREEKDLARRMRAAGLPKAAAAVVLGGLAGRGQGAAQAEQTCVRLPVPGQNGAGEAGEAGWVGGSGGCDLSGRAFEPNDAGVQGEGAGGWGRVEEPQGAWGQAEGAEGPAGLGPGQQMHAGGWGQVQDPLDPTSPTSREVGMLAEATDAGVETFTNGFSLGAPSAAAAAHVPSKAPGAIKFAFGMKRR